MNQPLDAINKINFGKVIADDLITFLEKVNSERQLLEVEPRVNEESLFYFTRILFHLQLYRLYCDIHDPVIDRFIERILILVNTRLSPDRLNDLTTLCIKFCNRDETGNNSWYDLSMDTINKDHESRVSFHDFYQQLTLLVEKNPDEFRMMLIKLVDLVHALTLTTMYSGLRKDVLSRISDKAFRKRYRSDLWTTNRKATMRTFKSLILLERLPYLFTVFFAIIGFLLTYLFNEYKDLTIIKYDWTCQTVSIDELLLNDADQIFTFYLDTLARAPAGQLKTKKDSMIYIIHKICPKGSTWKSLYYRNEITFRNISKFYLKGIKFTFIFKGNDRVIYGNTLSTLVIRSYMENRKITPIKASFQIKNMPPGSNIILKMITTTKELPLNVELPFESGKILLMKDNIFNWILDSRLNSILILILLSAFIIVLNLILYAKFSSQES